MTNLQQWLRTPMAAIALGCSQNHLKRSRDTHGGFLVGGEHYVLGSSNSAAILWNVDAIRQKWHEQGMKRYQITKELQAQ
jgi:hypothetical protein